MIEEDTGRLMAILEAEEELYVRLRDLLQHERELMVQMDAAGLEEVTRRKEALADEGRLVEESRLAVASELATRLDLRESRPTLAQLCERLGAASRPLREAHTRLVVLVTVVRELLDANVALAGETVSQIRGTLRLLGRLGPGEATYDPAEPERREGLASGQILSRTA